MSGVSGFDSQCMSRALELAERGLTTTNPNPRVGCVIAKDGTVISEGWHERAGEPHAEIHALRGAGEAARNATMYVTLEPCTHFGRTPPCVDAVIASRVARVVCAMSDPNPRVSGEGIKRLRAAGIDVTAGLLETEARALNNGYVQRMEKGLPWVRLKLAASLDGRIALADGTSRWITGAAARADVQRWRARSSAILTGAATVLRDDPQLNVRLDDGKPAERQPLRVIADSELRTSPAARVLSPPGQVMIFAARPAGAARSRLESRGACIETVPAAPGGIDLSAVMRRLGELEVNEVWVEAGARLAGALISARLVNELVVYFAPDLLGDKARGMFELPELFALEGKWPLKFADVRLIGRDLRVIAECLPESSRPSAP
ncbi:MAG TPA: bifunctional diaminohydroxyphosphoribosylaminopyrimidine deaminase/5-amino-6-(5-phosphoribosylamino)uracil reductase RibD [Steroidobacteraceae bacterium]